MPSKLKNQLLPIIVAFLTFLFISGVFALVILGLNLFPGEKILFELRWSDVLIGLTIYLKTAIDFALLIGILMNKFTGVKNRLMIEIGTALGNGLGTVAVLVIWFFFKEVTWLLALMIFFASLVLLKLAQSSLEHAEDEKTDPKTAQAKITKFLKTILHPINKFLDPVLSKIVPDLKFDSNKVTGTAGLFLASFTIPFILGMDDFAGYVPLFNVVNVLGFGIGVFAGHLILNIFLFLNPQKTIQVIKNPIIAILGSVAFLGIALWGFWEVWHLVSSVYFH